MDTSRIARGFGWGIVATLAMSVPMVIGFTTGTAPMPKPIPKALVGSVLSGLPNPVYMVVTIGAHLTYGGVWGAVLAAATRPATTANGLGFGVLLWLLMGVVFLPYLGWGFFGTAVAPAIAVATLVLHLVYGGTLGWTLDHEAAFGLGLSESTPEQQSG